MDSGLTPTPTPTAVAGRKDPSRAMTVVDATRALLPCGQATRAKRDRDDRNEDLALCSPRLGTFAVFDGVGGHGQGAVAARVARRAIRRQYERLREQSPAVRGDAARVEDALREALAKANGDVIARAAEEHCRGMGTTCALVHVVRHPDDGIPLVGITANVGDSRVYRFRDRALERMTRDDSALEREFGRDDLPKPLDQVGDPEYDVRLATSAGQFTDAMRGLVLRYRNMITAFVGLDGAEPTLRRVDLAAGDVLLATSDGIHDNLTDREIAAISRPLCDDPQRFAEELVDAARRRAGEGHVRSKEDDMTAVVVRIVAVHD